MQPSITDIPVKRIDGASSTLDDFSGQVMLIVNVASKCGLTPQYEGLEALQQHYAGRGFTVLGFPANDFGAQEPGTDDEIQAFCTTNYGVDFPMFSKIVVTGEHKHPLYRVLTQAAPSTPGRERMEERLRGRGRTPTSPPEVLWNFEKFLVGRDGRVVARFAPDTKPDDPELIEAIERALLA
ncbi:glutathione peroxidase [Verticiella sediminum]|uniref:Glutathione peroxidase n=1 Tax=Verticiella sediminum TaxID=1247510 RepID=A0A556AC94_9BURK|nr:glutathione peroxidase [Verticiella sediminum]TSH90497.1 glutathione peroxidase [Verticiella sediminum]